MEAERLQVPLNTFNSQNEEHTFPNLVVVNTSENVYDSSSDPVICIDGPRDVLKSFSFKGYLDSNIELCGSIGNPVQDVSHSYTEISEDSGKSQCLLRDAYMPAESYWNPCDILQLDNNVDYVEETYQDNQQIDHPSTDLERLYANLQLQSPCKQAEQNKTLENRNMAEKASSSLSESETFPPVVNIPVKSRNFWNLIGMGQMVIGPWKFLVFNRSNSLYVNTGLMCKIFDVPRYSIRRKVNKSNCQVQRMRQLELQITKYFHFMSCDSFDTELLKLSDFLNIVMQITKRNSELKNTKEIVKEYIKNLYSGNVPVVDELPVEEFLSQKVVTTAKEPVQEELPDNVSLLCIEGKVFHVVDRNKQKYFSLSELFSNKVFLNQRSVNSVLRKMKIGMEYFNKKEGSFVLHNTPLLKFHDLRLVCGVLSYQYPSFETKIQRRFMKMDYQEIVDQCNKIRTTNTMVHFGNDVEFKKLLDVADDDQKDDMPESSMSSGDILNCSHYESSEYTEPCQVVKNGVQPWLKPVSVSSWPFDYDADKSVNSSGSPGEECTHIELQASFENESSNSKQEISLAQLTPLEDESLCESVNSNLSLSRNMSRSVLAQSNDILSMALQEIFSDKLSSANENFSPNKVKICNNPSMNFLPDQTQKVVLAVPQESSLASKTTPKVASKEETEKVVVLQNQSGEYFSCLPLFSLHDSPEKKSDVPDLVSEAFPHNKRKQLYPCSPNEAPASKRQCVDVPFQMAEIDNKNENIKTDECKRTVTGADASHPGFQIETANSPLSSPKMVQGDSCNLSPISKLVQKTCSNSTELAGSHDTSVVSNSSLPMLAISAAANEELTAKNKKGQPTDDVCLKKKFFNVYDFVNLLDITFTKFQLRYKMNFKENSKKLFKVSEADEQAMKIRFLKNLSKDILLFRRCWQKVQGKDSC